MNDVLDLARRKVGGEFIAHPMAIAAAIDRIVHHSAILEFDMPSYRIGVAKH